LPTVILSLQPEIESGQVILRKSETNDFGLIASSKAQRLKPHAVDIRRRWNPGIGFSTAKKIRDRAYHLEDAATELQVWAVNRIGRVSGT